MKRLIVIFCALLSAISVFAYGGFGSSDEMSDFMLIVMVAYIILSIVVLIRWWNMTEDVNKIRQHITHANTELTYLVAIGEKERAQKAALTMLVDLLFPIYMDSYNYSKAAAMNKEIQKYLPNIQKLGLSVPDYVTTGEKFIDYMNDLTGGTIPYKDETNANESD